MNRTQLYLPKSQLDWLKKTARKKQTTASAVMRELVYEKQKSSGHLRIVADRGESLYESAKRISKLGTKGPKDLAKNMDKYLYGEDFR